MSKRKLLLIGGTGTISTAITRSMAQDPDWEVYLFNRGQRHVSVPENVTLIKGDIKNEEEAKKILEGMTFDCVGEFVGFTPDQVEKDIGCSRGKRNSIFLSVLRLLTIRRLQGRLSQRECF